MSTETYIEAGNTKPRIQFTADGQQKEFQFFFKIYEPENVKVYVEDEEQMSGYSLSTTEDVQGGIIIFDQPPQSGKLVTIYRELELKRTTNFKEGGPFRSSNVNSEFDYQLSCLEQLEDSIGRTVTFPQYAPTNLNINLPMPDAGKSIIWSDNEDCLVNSDYQFDNVVNLSTQYCNQTKEYMDQANNLLIDGINTIEGLKTETETIKSSAQNYAQQAQQFAQDASNCSVNSLYNQMEHMSNFTVELKDGITIYQTPKITTNTAISFDVSRIAQTTGIVTFELYIDFGVFSTITFNNVEISWLNQRVPDLVQNHTPIKILTFRNRTPFQFEQWIGALEGGYL